MFFESIFVFFFSGVMSSIGVLGSSGSKGDRIKHSAPKIKRKLASDQISPLNKKLKTIELSLGERVKVFLFAFFFVAFWLFLSLVWC